MTAKLALILVIGCAVRVSAGGRIVGGFPLNITQVPWQVSLQTHGGTYQYCGGAIIGRQWILTAAHCATRIAEVRVGATHKYAEGQLMPVKKRFTHKKYSFGYSDYDYGLLQLDGELQFSDRVRSIKLPGLGDTHVEDGTICLVSGWGRTRNSAESTDLLRGVHVPVVAQRVCNTAYEGKITARMICAGYKNGGKDSCQGDSGGPLATFDTRTKEPILVGIVSWGQGCGEAGYPGVYARVAVARDWIQSIAHI